MATQHYNYTNISANKNQNVIAASAYNSRVKKYDEAENEMKYPHANKRDHVGETIVMAPKGTSEEWYDPERLWNEAKKVDPVRQGKTLIIAIPHELIICKKPGSTDIKDYDIRICVKMLKEHCQKEFVDKGHACQIDFHLSFSKKTGRPNFHAHVLVTERQIVNGKWADVKSHKVYLDENNNIIQPIESPDLHFGKLKYNRDGSVKMTLGYTILQYDEDGKPLLKENGYPVLKDIRVPAIDPTTGLQATSKNGKKRKPEWHSRKEYADDLDVKDHVDVLRQSWYNLQNVYYKNYKITDKSGKPYQVDYRPFKEKFKNLPPELQPRPTRHVGNGNKKTGLIEYNEAVTEDRKQKQQIRRKIQELRKKKQESTAKKNKDNILTLNEKKQFFETFNPRDLFINRWKNNYLALQNAIAAKDQNLVNRLSNVINNNNRKRSRIDKQTPQGQACLRKLQRQNEALERMQNDLISFYNPEISHDIESAAGKKFDTLTNQEKAKYIKETCKENAALIVGEILNLDHNDGTDALDIENIPIPYYPKDNENEEILKKASRHFFKTDNYQEIEDNINNSWKETPEEAPPEAMATLINMYHTAVSYYSDTLNNKSWAERKTITDYHPEQINQDYLNEIEEIKRQEAAAKTDQEKRLEAERQRKATEAAEREQKEQERIIAEELKRKAAARAIKEKERLNARQNETAAVPLNPKTVFHNLWNNNPVDATLYLIKQTEAGAIPYNINHNKTISTTVKTWKNRTIDATINNKTTLEIYNDACREVYDNYPTFSEAVAEYRTELENHSKKLNSEAKTYAPRELQEYKDLGLLLKAYHRLNPELKNKTDEIDYSDILKRAKERNPGLNL